VKPVVESSPARGRRDVQVPVEVRQDRRTALAMRWLIEYSTARGEKTMVEKLAGEILDVRQQPRERGEEREDTHKMAEANKAFAHYRW